MASEGRSPNHPTRWRHHEGPFNYHWERGEAGSWAISCGVSRFLIAKGPGWTVLLGLKILNALRKENPPPHRNWEKRAVTPPAYGASRRGPQGLVRGHVASTR